MKRLMATLAICGIGSAASAWGLFGTAGVMVHNAAAGADADTAAAIGACVTNFSKDGCEGVVEPGVYERLGCVGTDCKTIRVRDAVYVTDMKSSGLACSGTPGCLSRCDEFPDGRMTLKFDYILRADSCCPFRGSWVGKWEYRTNSGRVYAGEAHGTIGVGTNRESRCDVAGDKCEKCYDVQTQDNTWLVGIEGSFRGHPLLSPTAVRDELNFTMDGTWVVERGTHNPFGDAFRVFNRFDGVFIDYCP